MLEEKLKISDHAIFIGTFTDDVKCHLNIQDFLYNQLRVVPFYLNETDFIQATNNTVYKEMRLFISFEIMFETFDRDLILAYNYGLQDQQFLSIDKILGIKRLG